MAIAKKKTFTAKAKKSNAEIIESINDKVIEGLKEKGLQWFKPFKDSVTGSFEALRANGQPYKGWNQFILSGIARENGWINKWYTFKNINDSGFRVNKGEKCTSIYIWNKFWVVEKNGVVTRYYKLEAIPKEDLQSAEIKFFLKEWQVYSMSQTNMPHNMPNITDEDSDNGELEKQENAEAILQGWTAVVPVRHSLKGEAYYSPSMDFIQMPEKSSKMWKSSGDYYKVFFHEAIHSTGHKSRLDRLDTTARFGNEEYSKEELVAEMGALYLEAITGIDCLVDDFKNSQAYINGWIKAITDNKDLIIQSSKKSQEAVALILEASK